MDPKLRVAGEWLAIALVSVLAACLAWAGTRSLHAPGRGGSILLDASIAIVVGASFLLLALALHRRAALEGDVPHPLWAIAPAMLVGGGAAVGFLAGAYEVARTSGGLLDFGIWYEYSVIAGGTLLWTLILGIAAIVLRKRVGTTWFASIAAGTVGMLGVVFGALLWWHAERLQAVAAQRDTPGAAFALVLAMLAALALARRARLRP